MRSLPPEAVALLAAVHAPMAVRERLLGPADVRLAALAALRTVAVPALVPDLLPLVFGETGALRDGAVAVLERALTAATPSDLRWLDEACRRAGGWVHDPPPSAVTPRGWRALTPAALRAPDRAASVAVIGVASFHPYLQVRLAAVSKLRDSTDGREIPFLVIRLNDWVPVIAAEAGHVLERRVLPRFAAAWVDALPLLLRLGPHTRRNPNELVGRVFAMLRAPEQTDVLQAAFGSGDRDARRTCARLLRESDAAPDAHVAFVTTALRDGDPVVRREAVAGARQHFADDALEALLPTVLADPYPPVRRDALAAAAERLGERATPWLIGGLLDRGRSAREFAQFHLARRGVLTDFAGYYREQIDAVAGAPGRLAVATAALGETGRASDAPALVPLLAHARPAVRRAAARALGRLDAAGHGDHLLSLLQDPSPGVTHAARDALRAHRASLAPAALLPILHGSAPAHGKLDALALADTLSKWDRLAVLLDAVTARDTRVRDDARRRLEGWIARQNVSFAQPSAAQRVALRASLARSAAALPPTAVSELGSILDYWTR